MAFNQELEEIAKMLKNYNPETKITLQDFYIIYFHRLKNLQSAIINALKNYKKP